MTRNFKFSIDEYYHGYNRGNDKRDIFLDDIDKERFQKILYLCNGSRPLDFREIPEGINAYDYDVGQPIVAIGSYELMSNHVHVLAKEVKEGGFSAYMQRVGTAHTMYFNKKYDRSGGLFQGTYKAKHIDNDRYLKYIYAYIHLNAVDLIEPRWKERGIRNINKINEHLKNYKFSSLPDFVGPGRIESKILNKELFPKYFESPRDIWNDLNDWLDYDPKA